MPHHALCQHLSLSQARPRPAKRDVAVPSIEYIRRRAAIRETQTGQLTNSQIFRAHQNLLIGINRSYCTRLSVMSYLSVMRQTLCYSGHHKQRLEEFAPGNNSRQ